MTILFFSKYLKTMNIQHASTAETELKLSSDTVSFDYSQSDILRELISLRRRRVVAIQEVREIEEAIQTCQKMLNLNVTIGAA